MAFNAIPGFRACYRCGPWVFSGTHAAEVCIISFDGHEPLVTALHTAGIPVSDRDGILVVRRDREAGLSQPV